MLLVKEKKLELRIDFSKEEMKMGARYKNRMDWVIATSSGSRTRAGAKITVAGYDFSFQEGISRINN